MPWCPKCYSEYREGFSRCTDCDVELSKEKPVPSAPIAEEDSWAEGYKWMKLAAVQDEHEADILENLLAEGGIPVLRKPSVGQQAMGTITGGSMGLDLFVPQSMRVEAMALLKDEIQGEIDEKALETEAVNAPLDEEEEDQRGGYYVVGFLILLVLIIWWITR